MDQYTTRAIDGGLDATLTKAQIRTLAIAARKAFAEMQRLGFVHPADDFDAWRHHEQFTETGMESLRQMRQRHYRQLYAHWMDMIGRPMQALYSRQRAAMDPARQARAKLESECQTAADLFGSAAGARNYAAGFLRNKRRVEMDQAGSRDLWHAIFVIRRRKTQLKKTGLAINYYSSGALTQESQHA